MHYSDRHTVILTAWDQVRRFLRFACTTLFGGALTIGDNFTDGMSQPCSLGLKSSTCMGGAKFCFSFLGIEAIALLLEAVKTFMIAVFVFDISVGKRMKTDRRKQN